MTLRIEKASEGQRTIFRLIGRIQTEHVAELQAQVNGGGPTIALDLHEVSLVDLDVVRFLGTCQANGMELLRCSPYIREWISREKDWGK